MARPGSSAAGISQAAFASSWIDPGVDRGAEIDSDRRSSLRANQGARLDAWLDGWFGDVSWPAPVAPVYEGRFDLITASSNSAVNAAGMLWIGNGLTSVDAGRVALLMAEDLTLVRANLVLTPAPGVTIPVRLLSRTDPADAFAPTGIVATISPSMRQLMLDPGLAFERGDQLVWEFNVPAGVTPFWVGESFAVDLLEP